MGLVEHFVENVSLMSIPLYVAGLIGAFTVYNILRITWQNIRIARLGTGLRPPSIRSWFPFNVDFIYQSIKSSMNHRVMEQWRWIYAHTHSHTAETRILGRRIMFTVDPDNIKAILATQFGEFGKGKPFHKEWNGFLGDSIFTTDGELWHNSRHLIRPQFIKDRVSDLQVFESKMDLLFKGIANGGALDGVDQYVNMAAGNGKPVDICDLFFRFTLDSATEFLLGKDVCSLSTPRQEFADAFQEVQRIQSIIARCGPLAPYYPRKEFKKNMAVIDHFVNQYIDLALSLSPAELESKTKGESGYTFLHELAGFTRDRKVLRDQLVAVLLAGRDTTACTLSWTIYELARHPECVKRLRAEILSVVGPDRAPTYDDLKSMKYLQNVMNETLRLYPVVPFNVRLALKDTMLPRGGGPDGSQPIPVLKDTPIGYSTLVMQRRPELYPPTSETFADPGTFSPERWYVWQPKPWTYIPFNGGPRICIGQQFALTEMGYVITRLFQKYERVDSHMYELDGGKPVLRSEIVLCPHQGVHVSFWEAKKSG
ncbi:putative cytochrome P450 of the CYP52 family [Rhypophila decipiens]|uniref:Cytochrome P450 of the CYP52 family n=1 Tax=Rhypophila decipiens TaxID=261697 RepID=A0AAN6YL51_9PEZI|nr:putative cytochrome P450 of the CYP52 family [Rhypophila decipiens]